jgi:hypothetical protein
MFRSGVGDAMGVRRELVLEVEVFGRDEKGTRRPVRGRIMGGESWEGKAAGRCGKVRFACPFGS